MPTKNPKTAETTDDLRRAAWEKFVELFGKSADYVKVSGNVIEADLCGDEEPINITYDKLKQLSVFFKTTNINVETVFGFDYSEWTPGASNSCKIIVTIEEE